MAKVLILKNKDFSTGFVKNNNGDKIAVYEDSASVYTPAEFAALPEYVAFEKDADEKKMTILERLQTLSALKQKSAVKEQQLINAGVFDLVYVPGTAAEVQAQFSAVDPVKKEVWIDSVTGAAKEIVVQPQYATKLVGGVISHNYNTVENSKIVNAALIEAAKIKTEVTK